MRSFKNPAELSSLVAGGVLQIPGSAHIRIVIDLPYPVEVHGDLILDKPARFQGSLEVHGTLLAQRGLVCDGNLRARGGIVAHCGLDVAGSIDSRLGIAASPGLRAGGDIATRGQLRADVGVTAGGNIRARKEVFAGSWIRAGGAVQGRSVTCPQFDIRCMQLITRTLPFGRGFWAALPELAPWREQIRDAKYCWNDLRELPTEDQRRAVARMPLHWSLQAQLSNFLGLTTEVASPEAA